MSSDVKNLFEPLILLAAERGMTYGPSLPMFASPSTPALPTPRHEGFFFLGT